MPYFFKPLEIRFKINAKRLPYMYKAFWNIESITGTSVMYVEGMARGSSMLSILLMDKYLMSLSELARYVSNARSQKCSHCCHFFYHFFMTVILIFPLSPSIYKRWRSCVLDLLNAASKLCHNQISNRVMCFSQKEYLTTGMTPDRFTISYGVVETPRVPFKEAIAATWRYYPKF